MTFQGYHKHRKNVGAFFLLSVGRSRGSRSRGIYRCFDSYNDDLLAIMDKASCSHGYARGLR